MTAVFDVRQLRRSFVRGGIEVAALDLIDLQIEPGEFVAITGPSGCGKTTLMQILGLLDRVYEGSVRYFGRDYRTVGAFEATRIRLAEIGFVFQQFRLIPYLDVRDNVAWPFWHLHGNRRKALHKAEELLSKLGLEHRIRSHVDRLSGGEMQRVAVARAIINSPRVVLADEPTGSLDAESAEQVVEQLRQVTREGGTLIAVTHNREVVKAASRTINVRYGRLANSLSGSYPFPRDLLANLNAPSRPGA